MIGLADTGNTGVGTDLHQDPWNGLQQDRTDVGDFYGCQGRLLAEDKYKCRTYTRPEYMRV
jgi:hypothetical protein